MELGTNRATATATIVTAFLNGRSEALGADEVARLVAIVSKALADAEGQPVVGRPAANPAADPQHSVFRDYIVCLECGQHVKLLAKHVRSHGMSREEYRHRFSLPNHYPMTAPAYAEARARIARKLDLGHSRFRKAQGRAA
jgi:predicted transcriptional regulator